MLFSVLSNSNLKLVGGWDLSSISHEIPVTLWVTASSPAPVVEC